MNLQKLASNTRLIPVVVSIAWQLLVCSCAEKHSPGADDAWERANPEDVGIAKKNLDSALSFLERHCYQNGLSEAILIKDGKVVFAGDSIEKQHNIWSCTKTFTSTALGLLIQDGKCSLDTKVSSVLPMLTKHYGEVTLRHLATMTSGYNAVGKSRWDGVSEDWSHTPFDPAEPLFPAGSAYAYWDEAQMIFGVALTKIAGEDLKAYLDRKLFDKIDFGPWSWQEEPFDTVYTYRNGCTGVEISAEQLAKFGLLFLNGDRLKEETLLPQEWIRSATVNQVSTDIALAQTDRRSADGRGNYGYNWWTTGQNANGSTILSSLPIGSAYMSGLNNNVCFVIPKWNMVFVRMGIDGNPAAGKEYVYNEFFRLLMAPIE